jgi:hypothetical protein
MTRIEAPADSAMRRNVLLIADSTSNLRPGLAIVDRFSVAGFELIASLLPGKALPSRAQLIETGLDCPVSVRSFEDLFRDRWILRFDVVVVFLPGSKLYELLLRMREALALERAVRRPVLITGYNGVVYEKHLEGLLWRVGYDLIGINSAHDHALFGERLRALGVDDMPLTRCGILLAQARAASPSAPFKAGSADLLFATQAIVPRSKSERVYVLQRLAELAEAFPERRVFVKPRTRPNERTFHVEKHHYERLADSALGVNRPPNLLFAYGSLSSLLDRVGMLLTVSSTAALEAVSRGVPSVVLTDLGINESLGNHFFVGSGMLASFDELIAGRTPEPDSGWLEQHGFGRADRIDALVERSVSLLDQQRDSGRMLPLRSPFYSPRRARFIYQEKLPGSVGLHDGPERDRKTKQPEIPDAPAAPTAFARKLRKLRRSPRRFFKDALLNALSSE